MNKHRISARKEENEKPIGRIPPFDEWFVIGRELTKIQFWSSRYDISFQFWGSNNNNVFIERDGVDITSFGGYDTPLQVLKKAVEWFEKTNPSVEYPKGIDISNPQP